MSNDSIIEESFLFSESAISPISLDRRVRSEEGTLDCIKLINMINTRKKRNNVGYKTPQRNNQEFVMNVKHWYQGTHFIQQNKVNAQINTKGDQLLTLKDKIKSSSRSSPNLIPNLYIMFYKLCVKTLGKNWK